MANANANDEIHKHGKTIILNKLVPTDYRMWVVQAEATLGVYECSEPAEMIKVYSVRENAVTIWTCLYKEYGHILDIEYIQADTQFHILRKEKETSMHDHIK